MKRKLIAAIGVAGMLFSVAACGDSDSGDKKESKGTDTKGKTLVVWSMDGSTPDPWKKAVAADFEKKTGSKIKWESQVWNGIQQKITTALSESSPPDVIEIGNTQTPAYAATEGLAELGDLKTEIGGEWTEALNKSSIYNDKQYAVPWYFANRVVLYNKKIWAEAGLKDTPKTRDDFFKALDTIKEKTKAEPLYMAGQNWYFLDGLIIGKGADLVKKEGDKYVSNLSDPKVGEAMELYKKYASYSSAPKDKDEATPQQADVFANGKTAMFIGNASEATIAVKANAKIEKDIGYFTIPGESAEKPESVFLGGSNLAVPLRSKNQELAKEFLKIALADEHQIEFSKLMGFTPNKASLLPKVAGSNAGLDAAAPAAAFGGTTPLIPEWAAVENVPNPIKDYMTAVLNGKSHADAAKDADAEINKRLAQGS
ncbi:extracellular solute-binding protein [Streptomyces uncialis]|uniref:Sugar transporter n=1 Tax=Streptomyces uncialis TaxID=1048205 RepID=A0A1Q4VF24_9ACTN|nr:extracellular solute-binding protein [Streptomyces uncialis]MCX4660191.1 extracellular solute-binding protein [Streptomyces uncialis]OKH96424.1 sugar transporter [Streptomyces uncialis]WTE13132.1 extracellular solute-binding protein [Streptomyces uncialis]